MVEILQKRKVERGFHVGVGVVLRHNRGEVYGELFVRNGGFESALVYGLKHADFLLLLLFYAAGESKLSAYIVVVAVPRKVVQKPLRFEFGAVHENYAHLGVGVCFVFVVCLGVKFVPVLEALVHGHRLESERV